MIDIILTVLAAILTFYTFCFVVFFIWDDITNNEDDFYD